MRILVAEDNELQCNVLKELMVEEGYDCVTASNGQMALDMVRSQNIDLIISDLDMPVLDGLHFAKLVKKDETFKTIPFIMYSSRPNRVSKEACDAIGVDKFVEEAGIRGVPEAVKQLINK